jgi:hypothetical protein
VAAETEGPRFLLARSIDRGLSLSFLIPMSPRLNNSRLGRSERFLLSSRRGSKRDAARGGKRIPSEFVWG